ncbi:MULTISPECIES: glycerophosphodiester phosphodiesterase family protein [unclassified Sulfitobacter]|jgi:glycerophosphoryl diester phosphodiesterase|uniref:glycerophosphodiester phosphodiesterase family protein n=1 Tax=unclassified Sulfitobacter TaxID=196795 RepID=UPI0015942A1E|nr:glycerophosphodiester phosphodiesterase family protein [Sulfitobacter sp. HGT1]MBQ0805322.1 phosphodiesterase [Sulfitobacter sp.]
MTFPAALVKAPFAHRGFHDLNAGRPENSPAAFSAAVERGYAIELDVQLSSDGQAMVFHDYALDRLTAESGPIQQRTAEALAQIKLKGGTDTIQTLPQILSLIDGRVPLLVEIKDQDGAMGDAIGPLEVATARALHDYAGDVAVMSFNPHSVARMALLAPDLTRGIVSSAYRYADWPLSKATCDHLREIPDYGRSGASFISHEVDDLSRPRVADLRKTGAMVCCWTVRSTEIETTARQYADNITFEGYDAVRPA